MTDTVDETFIFKPIGTASTWFVRKNGTPRQPSVSSLTRGSIKISKNVFSNPEHSLENLSQFSHVWVLFLFHKNSGECTKAKVAPPRLNGQRVGVFSTRSPHRPNPIGLTLATVEKIEGDTLYLSGLDLLDSTPIIDIKPYIPSYDTPQIPNAEANKDEHNPTVENPSWASLKSDDKILKVTFTETAVRQIKQFSADAADPVYRLQYLKSSDEAFQAVRDILSEDPRSVYRRKKCQDRLYFCIVDQMHVTSWFDEMDNKCEVVRVVPVATRQAKGTATGDSSSQQFTLHSTSENEVETPSLHHVN